MKRGLRRFLTLVLLVMATTFLLVACGPSAPPPKGQQIFAQMGCNACHGDKGEGGRFLGAPKLAGTKLSFDEAKEQVRKPRSQMPPAFTEAQLSDADLQEIYDWIKALP